MQVEWVCVENLDTKKTDIFLTEPRVQGLE